MGRFNAAKIWGAIDNKMQLAYNYLIDLLDSGYKTEAKVNGKQVVVDVNPQDGITITVDGTVVFGIDSNGNLFASRFSFPADPTVSWGLIGTNGSKNGLQLYKHSVSDTVPFASIACGTGSASDPTVHYEYMGVEIASFTNANGWVFGDGVTARLYIKPNGDILAYDENGELTIWQSASGNFIQLHTPSTTDNAIGVDNTGAYKITGGVKAYL